MLKVRTNMTIKTTSAIKQSFKYASSHLIVVYFFVVLFISVLEIVLPIFEGNLIDGIVENNNQHTLTLALVIAGMFVQGALYFLLYNMYTKVKNSIINTVSNNTLKSIVMLNRKNIHKKGAGFYHEFLSREPDLIAACADPSAFFFVFSIIIALAATAISLQYTYAFVIVIPVAIIMYLALNKLFTKKFDNLTDKLVDVMYSAEPKFISYIETAKTIAKFGNTKHYMQNLTQCEKERQQVASKYILVKELRNGLSEIISSVAFVALICVIFFDIQKGNITYGRFVILLSYFPLMLMPLLYHSSMKMAVTDAAGSFDMLNSIQNECNDSLKKMTQYTVSNKNELAVHNVCFTYSHDKISDDKNNMEEEMDFQYNNISFSIKDTDGLSLIGASGEGKSTIVKLLLGELIPQSGSITINGANVSELPQAVLDYLICVYEQEKTILPCNLMENICLGRKLVSDDEYKSLLDKYTNEFRTQFSQKKLPLELANLFAIDVHRQTNQTKTFIANFLNANPDALFFASMYRDTQVVRKTLVDDLINTLGIAHLDGRDFGEDGAEVSGGERERIAMARFLSRENASLYIIDEPFTALDSKTEDECLKLLVSKMQNKRRLIVSHKFNVLRSLSKSCIVIKDGIIIENGMHSELENASGLYAELLKKFNAQRS